jgi:hypothetical protein
VQDELDFEKDKDQLRSRLLEAHEGKSARLDKEALLAKEDAKRSLDRYEEEVRERAERQQTQIAN